MKALLTACVLCTILVLGCQSNNAPQSSTSQSPKIVEEPQPTQPPTIPSKPETISDIKLYWGQTRCQVEIKPGTLIITNNQRVIERLDATKRAILVKGQNIKDGESIYLIMFIEMDHPKNRPEILNLYWVNKSFLDEAINIGGFKHAVPRSRSKPGPTIIT